MSLLREKFSETGLVSITSPSIVRDCATLLYDLWSAGVHLQLLPINKSDAALIANAMETLNNEERAQEGLLVISDFISTLIFKHAKEHRGNISRLYDLAKHLQSFHSLLANSCIQRHMRDVLDSLSLLMHKDSVGIRMDLPNEEAQLTKLHQEFHSFPFGINAAVLWVPLTRIGRYSGTLSYFPRPHLSDPIPFSGDTDQQDRLIVEGRLQEAQKTGGLETNTNYLGQIQYLETKPGQCFIFSAVLPHSSVPADSMAKTARLTCQARFFDLNDPYFVWKHRSGTLWDGLKRPTVGWQYWKDYKNEK